MDWDKRADDHGKESLETILARIDERVNNLITLSVGFRQEFDDHKKDNDIKFNTISKNMWMGIGALTTITLIIDVIFRR